MERRMGILWLFGCALLVSVSGCSRKKPDPATLLHPERLRCEFLSDPEGVDSPGPRLAWSLRSDGRGQSQTAYRILASGSKDSLLSDRGDLWDSGKVLSGQTGDVRYAGRKPGPGDACHWKVKVWDKDGRESEWSEPGFWRAGIGDAPGWKASWIGLEKAVGRDDSKSAATRCSARMLRKEFDVSKKVKQAVAFYSGLGLSELYVNGKKAGDDVLSPGLTDYEKTVFYVTRDVTASIRTGKNADRKSVV